MELRDSLCAALVAQPSLSIARDVTKRQHLIFLYYFLPPAGMIQLSSMMMVKFLDPPAQSKR